MWRAQAPKVEAGIHLLYWDSGMDSMLVNARNMEVQNHWGPVDASAQLPPERISQFFGQRASYYVPSTTKVRAPHQICRMGYELGMSHSSLYLMKQVSRDMYVVYECMHKSG